MKVNSYSRIRSSSRTASRHGGDRARAPTQRPALRCRPRRDRGKTRPEVLIDAAPGGGIPSRSPRPRKTSGPVARHRRPGSLERACSVDAEVVGELRMERGGDGPFPCRTKTGQPSTRASTSTSSPRAPQNRGARMNTQRSPSRAPDPPPDRRRRSRPGSRRRCAPPPRRCRPRQRTGWFSTSRASSTAPAQVPSTGAPRASRRPRAARRAQPIPAPWRSSCSRRRAGSGRRARPGPSRAAPAAPRRRGARGRWRGRRRRPGSRLRRSP